VDFENAYTTKHPQDFWTNPELFAMVGGLHVPKQSASHPLEGNPLPGIAGGLL
jgi:hypothetical protein